MTVGVRAVARAAESCKRTIVTTQHSGSLLDVGGAFSSAGQQSCCDGSGGVQIPRSPINWSTSTANKMAE
jgi:hypothetical protein